MLAWRIALARQQAAAGSAAKAAMGGGGRGGRGGGSGSGVMSGDSTSINGVVNSVMAAGAYQNENELAIKAKRRLIDKRNK
jgi:hypothetical protein